MKRRLTVCYFGAYHSDYPRNYFYRWSLEQLGVAVVECRVPVRHRTISRAIGLALAFWRGAHLADAMIVAEFNHSIVPLAWMLARLRGMAIIFDPGLSFYDEHVLRAKDVAPTSLRGIYLRWMEALAYRLSDVVVWFTPVDEEYFRELFGIASDRSAWLPPGVDTHLFQPTPLPAEDTPLIVHWDGNMSPTHGVDVILRAAKILAPEGGYVFEIVGGALPSIQALANELRLPNVQFLGIVSADELRASVQRAHICLGIFRDDDKLRRSLYTKEMQAMMVGRPLVTAYGEAKARLFVNYEHLVMISPEDSVALANALRALREDAAFRRRLAGNAAEALMQLCAPESAGMKMLGIIEKALSRRRRVAVGQNPSPPL